MRQTSRSLIIILSLFILLVPATSGFAQSPIVRAVLFYSPTCPHCHEVMTEHLPPLTTQYGEQLQIVAVDVSVPGGNMLYETAIEQYAIPPERQGVPLLIVGDYTLVGSIEIPAELPGIIEAGIQAGGIDWPPLPGLVESIPEDLTGPVSGGLPADIGDLVDDIVNRAQQPGFAGWFARAKSRFMLDPLANSLSVVVLIGMIVSLIWAVVLLLTRKASPTPRWVNITLPILSLVGLAVAGYLTYVEATQSTALCGPVGDCNAVQQSSYARLFGVLPVGVLGLIGYITIAAAWLVSQKTSGKIKRYTVLTMMGMTFFGVSFSTYLTYLEPFVIGASCMWCLSSAVIITAQMWLALHPTLEALDEDVAEDKDGE
jgi:uncharacterized membrane protein